MEKLYELKEKITKKGYKFINETVRDRIKRKSVLYFGRNYENYLTVRGTTVSRTKGKEAIYEWLTLEVVGRKEKEKAIAFKEEELLLALLSQIECNEFNEPKQLELFNNENLVKNYENYIRTVE